MSEKKLLSPARGGTTVYDRKSKPCETGIVKQGITAKNNPPIRRDRCGKKGNKEMKKLMFALATAAALVGMADIESANTVGYTTKAIAGDMFYLVSTPFVAVGASGNSVSFDRVMTMTGVEAVPYDDMYDSAAEILLRDPETGAYTSYYYINDAIGEAEIAWADEVEGEAIAGSALQSLGRGFWLHTPATVAAGATITVAGEVSEVEKFEVPFAAGFQILANPFPVATDLSKVVTTGVTPVAYDDMYDSGAEILVRDFETGVYTSYFYINDAIGDTEIGWADEVEGAIVTGPTIPAGASFWMNSPSSGKLTFTK